jgi:uridine kinase
MSDSFEDILRRHAARYPEMQPQDYAKLAYQSEFGPAHILCAPERAEALLLAEWQALAGTPAAEPEPIGSGLCRFALTGEYPAAQAAPLLMKLLKRTASEHTGTAEGLEKRLAAVSSLGVPGMEPWLKAYRAEGCPPISHSERYRAAYHPHYRLLKTEYACFFSAVWAAARAAESGTPVCIGIDGRCASGKTTLAALLAELFSCNVFHMDDFYLPPAERPADWRSRAGGNMDFARLRQEVVLPALAGKPVDYRAYSCREGRLLPARRIAPRPLTVIEGSYSAHPALGVPYAARIFLTCSPEVQARRLQKREGGYYEAFQNTWIPMEEHYLKTFPKVRTGGIVLDTGGCF